MSLLDPRPTNVIAGPGYVPSWEDDGVLLMRCLYNRALELYPGYPVHWYWELLAAVPDNKFCLLCIPDAIWPQ